MVPAGTPKAAIDQINKWFVEAVGSDETKKFLGQFGGDPLIETPEQGQARLEVRRLGDDVIYRALPAATFAFRAALAARRTLEDAVEQALDADPAFGLAGEIRALLDERVLVRPE